MFTDILFEENKALWQKYLDHPFITGMEDGSLDIDAFKYYMIQDYHYLMDYTKVFAIGLTKAQTIDDIEYFADAIKGVSWEIDHVHKKYMMRIGITEDEIKKTAPSLTNLGYTSYMLAKASDGDMLNAYIAVLSCSWSYAYIGKIMLNRSPELIDNSIYGEWLAAYSSDEYQRMNDALIDRVNQKCRGLSEVRQCELATIFKVCSEFELKFWDMAYQMNRILI